MEATSLRSIKPCRRTKVRLARAVRRQSTPPPLPVFTYKRLPFEILNMIFEYAVAPSFLLDSSLNAGPNSSWCQARKMKLSIIQVSRDWYTEGIALAYKEVVFRQLNQIPALLESLEASPEVLGPLVKTLTLDMFIPSEYGASFTRHIQRIVDLCPRLEGLILSSPLPLPPTATLPELKRTIKHINAGPSVSPSELFPLLKSARQSIISMSIHVHDPPEQFRSTKAFDLPKLESLTIQVAPGGVNSWHQLPIYIPKLQRLTIEFARGHDAAEQSALKWDSMIPSITTFCRRFKDLKFLDVNPGFGRRSGKMQGPLSACPNLEHIVVYNGAQVDSHPTIKWVDICTHKMFGPDDDSESIYNAALIRLRKSLTRKAFPALRSTRRIHLCAPYLRDIPTRLPPGSVSSPRDGFEFNFPGIHLRHDQEGIHTLRHVDVGSIYEDDVQFKEFDYEVCYDPDEDGSDGTSEASERSLGRLRRREVDGCDAESSSSSESEESECPVRLSLWDTCLYGIRVLNRRAR